MEKLFVPYEEAKSLKDLGFNEKCLRLYIIKENRPPKLYNDTKLNSEVLCDINCSAPLYPQAFKWFREKHDLSGCIDQGRNINNIWFIFTISERKLSDESPEICRSNKEFKDYEQAELACLRKLIEITKQK